jgi:hypothetical protein
LVNLRYTVGQEVPRIAFRAEIIESLSAFSATNITVFALQWTKVCKLSIRARTNTSGVVQESTKKAWRTGSSIRSTCFAYRWTFLTHFRSGVTKLSFIASLNTSLNFFLKKRCIFTFSALVNSRTMTYKALRVTRFTLITNLIKVKRRRTWLGTRRNRVVNEMINKRRITRGTI